MKIVRTSLFIILIVICASQPIASQLPVSNSAGSSSVPTAKTDPGAEPTIPGTSQQRLATPVTLPFERSLPGPVTDWDLLSAEGKQGREYYLTVKPLVLDGFRYAQRRGRVGQGMKPWWVLSNRRTGQGLALMLAYMGNWTFEVLRNGDSITVRLRTSPDDLDPFTTVNGLSIPGALMAEFSGHWDYGAQPIVRFIREKLLRDLGPQWPLVQYNTWYDRYDKFTQEQIMQAARNAAGIGCELFTIDAGWFGEGNDAAWSKSLGDWEINRARLPGGLDAIAAAVHGMSMKFGLWFEIECAHPGSRLAAQHPDWFLVDARGNPLSKRGVLDFGKPEVVNHATRVLDDAVSRYSLDYIKLDFNTDLPIENESLTQATDPLFRHYRGLADLWSHMRAQHPALIIENCASGSLRQELTGAALTDTHWISDVVDNVANLPIMFGATYLFPAEICNHWTTRPDSKNPVVDLDAQFVVNMMGHMGLSGPIASWDAETLATAKKRIADYKRIRPLIRKADVFHLTTQQGATMQAALYVDPTTGRALLFAFQNGDPKTRHLIPLRGLDRNRRYRMDQGGALPGRKLVQEGLTVTFQRPGAAALIELEPVEE